MICFILKNIPGLKSFCISVITCILPTVSNASSNLDSPIEYNAAVTYACQPGYNHTDGDLTRACQANGSLTGSLPVCTGKLQRWFCISLLYWGHFRIYRQSTINSRLKHIQMPWKRAFKESREHIHFRYTCHAWYAIQSQSWVGFIPLKVLTDWFH